VHSGVHILQSASPSIVAVGITPKLVGGGLLNTGVPLASNATSARAFSKGADKPATKELWKAATTGKSLAVSYRATQTSAARRISALAPERTNCLGAFLLAIATAAM